VGDVAMSVAAMRELRRLFPSAHITAAARPGGADVLHDAACVDAVLTQSGSDWLPQVRQWRENKFDLAVLLQNAFQSAAIAFLARVPIRVGYRTDRRRILLTHPVAVPAWKNQRHEVYYYLNLVRELERLVYGDSNRRHTDADYTLHLTEQRRHTAFEILRRNGVRPNSPLVLLCPGSINSRAKRWPAERFAALADLLNESGTQVILIGSPAETEISREVFERSRRKPIILTGETTVAEVTGIISVADVLITNDTGPAHIGAAVGTPVLAIFGPTNPATTRPFAPNSEIIRQPPECAPCMLRDCPIDHRCMTAITADEVFAQVQRILLRHRAEVMA
jgi:heptosyltransferase-2